MTVQEVVEYLQKYPPNYEIVIRYEDGKFGLVIKPPLEIALEIKKDGIDIWGMDMLLKKGEK